MNDIQFRKNYSAWIGPAYPVQPESRNPKTRQTDSAGKGSFSEILQTVRQGGLTFSKHALQRMDERQIEVSPELMARMSGAAEKAKAKGVRDALMMSGDTAFIVNIPSSTVVTMMNGGEMKENIFTNIDGAVIL
ncbi:putative flagellar [Caprobacter fermentans]|uniref:Flagellar operon protein n=1 Tax=Caproicibacter fermentans TaxID=2576756 RepID=A0A6N8HVZ8_9FIRM|nr:TIGR02530 family flagellar biosynthesis protein [Caproicibacter fermentans]MVB09740.1 putative flagellar [Caproicibacter fermentans]OCN03148.1 flagellar operon protein [Clostridium sp. W14A]QNK42375.1 flagellar operon protein [Caproicibacter fermentans]